MLDQFFTLVELSNATIEEIIEMLSDFRKNDHQKNLMSEVLK